MSVRSLTRRTALRLGAMGLSVGLAGCHSPVSGPTAETPTRSAEDRCHQYRYPDRHLGVITLETASAPIDPPAIIHSDELPPGEKEIVTRAIEQGRYRICLPEAPETEVTHFSSFVDRIGDHAIASSENGYVAYVEHEGSYYRLTSVRKRDVVVVTAG